MRRTGQRRWRIAAAGLALTALLPVAGAPAPEGARLHWELDQALRQGRSEVHAPGVVAGLWMPGAPGWTGLLGVRNRQNSRPMRRDLHTRIGSVTKTVTVLALLLLVRDRLVSLDDPISSYVPDVPQGDAIQLRMLANMTSGLFNYTADPDFQQALFSNPQRTFTPAELLAYSFAHEPGFAPGSGWNYSNTNTVLLGLVVEKVSGLSLGEFFRQRIFAPLGMRGTVFPDSSDMPSPLAHGYTRQTLDGRVADSTFWNPSWAWAAGNLISTLDDLRILARVVATGHPLIPPELQQERLTWVTLPPNTPVKKYGLGIGSDHEWLGHSGELPGFNTIMYYFPRKEITLVVVVNSDLRSGRRDPAPSIARALARVVTPEHLPYMDEE